MEMKIPAIAITALVVITVLAGVLVPVLEDATAKTDDFSNTGVFYMDSIPESTTYHYVLSDGVWTVNDEVLPVPTAPAYIQSYNVLMTDTILFRANGQIRGTVYATVIGADLIVDSDSITGTITNTASQTSSINWPYTMFYGATPLKTNLVMSDPSASINYMLADSEIYGFGLTGVSGNFVPVRITGNLSNVSVTTTAENVTIANVDVNKTPVDGYIDLFDWDSITFDLTYNDTTVKATYTALVIPEEVTAERTVHFSDNESAIFTAIPIMVIIALLIAVVAMVFRSRQF